MVLGEEQVDSINAAVVIIDTQHNHIHSGKSFICTTYSDAEAVVLGFKTPDSPTISHIMVDYGAESNAHLEVFEGVTWTTSTGTKAPIYNRDRGSPNESVLMEDTTGTFGANMGMVKDPTDSIPGVKIYELYSWGRKEFGRTLRDRDEIIYKQDTQYILNLESNDGQKGLQLYVTWYEHTPLS